MKTLRSLFAGLALGSSVLSAHAQINLNPDAAPPATPADADLRALIGKLNEQYRSGNRSREAFAPLMAEFDVLLKRHPGKNDDSARIALLKAIAYGQYLKDEATEDIFLREVVANYPGTGPAKTAEKTLFTRSPDGKAMAKAQREAREAKLAALVGSPAPELNFTWTSRPGFKKLSDLKGNVVVLDFWATWCGPCIGTFPQVREKVDHFKGSPVVVLGVTSLQGFVANMGPRIDTKDNPQKEYDLMPQFMKEKNMTWDVAFSTENVFNPDYGIQGIPYVVIIAPDGTVRHTGLHPGNKAHDISGKITAILKEFNLPVPAAKG